MHQYFLLCFVDEFVVTNVFSVLLLRNKKFVNNLLSEVSQNCERFEPRSHFKSRLSLIVRVNVVLNRTVVVDSD